MDEGLVRHGRNSILVVRVVVQALVSPSSSSSHSLPHSFFVAILAEEPPWLELRPCCAVPRACAPRRRNCQPCALLS